MLDLVHTSLVPFRKKLAASLVLTVLGSIVGAAVVLAEDGEILARVEGRTVTEAEIMDLVAGDLVTLERQRHNLIAAAVNGRVQDILTEIEAERRGISKEELLEVEVQGKLAEVPAADVDAFYTSRRLRQPKESVEPQIRRYLAYQKLIETLEAKTKPEILTPPFRVDVEADGPSKGKETAPVTVVEFGDFECPPCGQAYPVMKQIAEKYADQVRIVFRHFPLREIHPNAQKAGEASICALDQGKFWDLHDKMFENQRNLSVAGLKEMAGEIPGLDAAAFGECLDDGRHAELVEEDVEEGGKIGVSGTPAFFVNGRFLAGAPSYEAFAKLIDDEIARQKESSGS
jgi:protein-disulfide isomerase